MFEVLEKKVIGGILGIKTGNKTANEVAPLIKRMEGINPHMAADYQKKYIKALEERKNKA